MQTIIRMRGPITREFTVLNQMLPVQFPHEEERYLGNSKAYIIARIEFFNDKVRRKRLITQTWSHLRLVDPSLLPWSLDETIASKNPQVLEKDHFMQTNCYAAFWTKLYSQNTKSTQTTVDHWMWCREHIVFYSDSIVRCGCGVFVEVAVAVIVTFLALITLLALLALLITLLNGRSLTPEGL